MFVLLKGVAKEASLVVAEHPKCLFMYHSYLIGNSLIIAGHTYKYCGLGTLIYLLVLRLNNSFAGNQVLSFVWGKKREEPRAQHRAVMGSCWKWSWLHSCCMTHCKILFSAICNFVELK